MNRVATLPPACPHDASRDDRKSARLAAEQLQVESGAEVVKSFAFGREILRSAAMRQAMDVGAERFDLNEPATTPVIFLDGEAHRRKRAAIAKFFTAKAMNTRYRAVMESMTDRLLLDLRAHGRAELDVISFALAVAVASEIVGLTDSNGAAMAQRIASAFASGTVRRRSRLAKAIGGGVFALKTLHFLLRDVRPAIRARRKARREDVISQLLDQGASDKAILMECMVYASAGMVTTREFIVMAAWHLFEDDELRMRFLEGGEDDQFAILDEILRLEPVAGMVYRRAAEDVPETLAGPMKAGTHFGIDIRAVNGDESAVGPCPHALDPDRGSRAVSVAGHLSFGDGAHRCPGAPVAMHETRVFLDRLFRIPGIRLTRAPDMLWNNSLMSYELRHAVVACDSRVESADRRRGTQPTAVRPA
jgi:cytochrome P450